MAKSMRSKTKRSYRAKKREDGVYAAIEAARLARLSSKLQNVRDTDRDGDVELGALEEDGADAEKTTVPDSIPDESPSNIDSMELDGAPKSAQKISTHGRRSSRKADWRASKGLAAHPKSRGMNRQGGIAAKSKAGRSHRRR